MTIHGEYTTVHFARSMYLSSSNTGQDDLLLSFIRQASREIDRVSGKKFFPTVESRKFDAPSDGSNDINLDAELFSLISITNGNGDVLTSSDVILLGNNEITKNKIRLLPTSGVWMPASSQYEQAITVTGVWTNMYDYTAGWLSTSFETTAELSAAATSFTATVDLFKAGDLLKIDDEILYVVSAVQTEESIPAEDPEEEPTVTTVDTVTVERAANGSTAAVHDISSPVCMWNPGYEIQMLTAIAAISYYQLRSNPLTSSYTADGVTIYTPKDITKYIKNKLGDLRLLRIGLA